MSESHGDLPWEEDERHYPPASILLIDDRPENLLALEALLEPLGHRLVKALSGEEALAHATREAFAVVLVDVRMPGLNGFETASRLRKLPNTRRTPVVLLSAAESDVEYAIRGYEVGAVDYLGKPLNAMLVRAKVQALVSLYRRGAELKRRADLIVETQRVAERAERENQLKDRFIGILSHDLRNPLNAIMTAGRLIQLAQSEAQMKEAAARILRSGTRMNEMIGELLDFTRGQLGGGIPVEPRPCDFGELCRSVVEELTLAHPDREIDFALEGELTGHWDPGRVEQAIGNLIGNAVRHGIGTITVRALGTSDQVILTVHNGGVPILPSDLPWLFEPLRTGERRAGGLGLGLYIVREIARAHGSRVEVRSSAKEGTTFTSYWPRQAQGALT